MNSARPVLGGGESHAPAIPHFSMRREVPAVELPSGGTRQLPSISNVRSCCTSRGLRKRRTGLGQPTHFVCSLLPLAVGRQLGNWLSMRAEHFSRLRQATCAPSDVPAPVNQVCRDGDSRKNLSPIECVFPPKTFSQECPSRCNRQIALSFVGFVAKSRKSGIVSVQNCTNAAQ